MDEVEARQAPTCGARAAWPARHCHPPPRPYHPQIPRRTLAASLLQPILAVWSLSALATSLASLFLLRHHPAALERPRVREPWYAALRVHRALAIVGMRRVLKDPVKLGRCARARSAASAISVHQCVMLSCIMFGQEEQDGREGGAPAWQWMRTALFGPVRPMITVTPPPPSRAALHPASPTLHSSPNRRSYFLKALLVNSSVLPILLQSIIFQLSLPLQALTQVGPKAGCRRHCPRGVCVGVKGGVGELSLPLQALTQVGAAHSLLILVLNGAGHKLIL